MRLTGVCDTWKVTQIKLDVMRFQIASDDADILHYCMNIIVPMSFWNRVKRLVANGLNAALIWLSLEHSFYYPVVRLCQLFGLWTGCRTMELCYAIGRWIRPCLRSPSRYWYTAFWLVSRVFRSHPLLWALEHPSLMAESRGTCFRFVILHGSMSSCEVHCVNKGGGTASNDTRILERTQGPSDDRPPPWYVWQSVLLRKKRAWCRSSLSDLTHSLNPDCQALKIFSPFLYMTFCGACALATRAAPSSSSSSLTFSMKLSVYKITIRIEKDYGLIANYLNTC